MATWHQDELGADAVAIRDVGLRDADDSAIFDAARQANVVVLAKDVDFVHLLRRIGPPPRFIWLTVASATSTSGRGQSSLRHSGRVRCEPIPSNVAVSVDHRSVHALRMTSHTAARSFH